MNTLWSSTETILRQIVCLNAKLILLEVKLNQSAPLGIIQVHIMIFVFEFFLHYWQSTRNLKTKSKLNHHHIHFTFPCIKICIKWWFDFVIDFDLVLQQPSTAWHSPTFGRYYKNELWARVRPRFFDQVGHETMYASSGNRNFFTKSCHRQTYQHYEQSQQKLGTILENKK